MCGLQLPLALCYIKRQMDRGKVENGVSHMDTQLVERQNGRIRRMMETSNQSEGHLREWVKNTAHSAVHRYVEQPLPWQGEVKARVQLASTVAHKCSDKFQRKFRQALRLVSAQLS